MNKKQHSDEMDYHRQMIRQEERLKCEREIVKIRDECDQKVSHIRKETFEKGTGPMSYFFLKKLSKIS